MRADPHRESGSSAKSFWNIFGVVVLSCFAMLLDDTDIALPWHAAGQFGIVADAAGNVVDVTPGSSAALAGIGSGDRIDFRNTPFESRRYLTTGAPAGAQDGTHARFAIARGSTVRDVNLVATRFPRSFADNVTNEFLMVSQIGLVLLAAFIVLKRPSRMTWAFFLYSTGLQSQALTTTAVFSAPVFAATQIVFSCYGISWIWLPLFALRFPNDSATGWRARTERTLVIALPILIPLNVWIGVGFLFANLPPPFLIATFDALPIVGVLVAALIFALTYVRATRSDRARIRWVMVGIVFGFSASTVFLISSEIPGLALSWPVWLINIVLSMQSVVAVTVAYAVVRHRVFDVRFFIGRAVVYGTLTTVVVATLALVDFAAGKVLSGTGLAAFGEAGVAVIVGLALSGLHRRIEHLVDTRLFRSRIAAKRRLQRVSRGLSHAATLESIESIVVREPVEAFRLASAAIFNRDETGAYLRGDCVGWDLSTLATIGRDDPLVLQLLASREPLRIRDVTLPPGALPAGAQRPSHAMSMVVRSDLEAIVFYGAHESQEELDPGEMETLEYLLESASSAYDHVRAEISQRELGILRAQLAGFRALGI